MAKKSNKRKKSRRKTHDDDTHVVLGMHIKKETKHSILSIMFFVLAIFFVLAKFGLGGVTGEFIYKSLSALLGVGYLLLPITFIIIGISTFKSNRPNLVTTHTISGILFLLSGLGLIHVATKGEHAGALGQIAAWPFMKFFDVYIAVLILVAIFIISLVLLFDKRPSWSGMKVFFGNMFSKKEDIDFDEDEEEEYEEEEEDEEEYEDEEYEDEEEEEEPEPEPEPEQNKEGFAMSAAFKPHSAYKAPPLSLLEKNNGKVVTGDIKSNSNIIQRTLRNFGISVEMDEVAIGPTVTRYSMKPAQGVRLSKITALSNELRLALAATAIRIEAPIPGQSLVGIEIPNEVKAKVGLRELLGNSEFKNSPKPLTIALGKGVSGKSQYANLAKMPHILIAGATGAGKSVTIHTLITSLLYRKGPEDLRFIMVDPKRVELTLYNGIPHLLTPVITNPKKAILSLKWAIGEMERRYDVLEGHAVRDIDSYNKKYEKAGGNIEENEMERMPYIVIIIDELADIMTTYPRELEAGIVRLAQMSRAVGIHLVLSTQRPSVNVITGLIKANVPSRIALQVTSQIDSRTILDTMGAEKLLGAGDMLYAGGEMSIPRRIQGAFISEDEVKKVTDYLKKRYKDDLPDDLNLTETTVSGDKSIFTASFDDKGDQDILFDEAKQIVVTDKKASTSYLQRKLKIGYSRAARLMDELEEAGIIGSQNGSKARDILIESLSESPVKSVPTIPTPAKLEKKANELLEEDEEKYEEDDEEDEEEELNSDVADDYEDDETEDDEEEAEDGEEDKGTEEVEKDEKLDDDDDYDENEEY